MTLGVPYGASTTWVLTQCLCVMGTETRVSGVRVGRSSRARWAGVAQVGMESGLGLSSCGCVSAGWMMGTGAR